MADAGDLDAAWLDSAAELPPDPRASVARGLRILWRRKWRFLLVFLPILLLAPAYLLLVPDRFVAQSMLLVGIRQPDLAGEQARDPIRGEPDIDGATALLRSQAALRHVAGELGLDRRPEFARAVRQEPPLLIRLRRSVAALLGRPAARDAAGPLAPVDAVADALRGGVVIDRVGRSGLLRVSYASSDPELAAAIVNALSRFAAEDEGFLDRLSLAERAGFQIVRMSVLAPAAPPPAPTLPNPGLVLGIGAFCAIAAGLGAVLLKEFRMQQTVLGGEEIARRGLRALGVMPEAAGGEWRNAGPGYAASVASLNAVVSTLVRPDPARGAVLLLTAALPAEGTSTTAAALAASMAASGQRVLLIDADLRTPSQHRLFDLAPAPGLADSLDAGRAADDAIRVDRASGVHVLTAGGAQAHPLATLGSDRLRDCLTAWRGRFDAVLLDTPPLLATGDALVLARLADQVIVVVRWGSTSWTVLREALLLIRDSGARLAGLVVARADPAQLHTYDPAHATPGPRVAAAEPR
ncbi:AAA family ATPase [Falsiroseomonas sp. HW251]|uniref:polysaccharide biosynthesis tyrosine autokinase n=1 Tax=Falsiroseomonas sp. HW251 TaxID=3390998 RepID=UPI003D314C8E